jgi:asparagine synthase (glutamine-hydrolysing)
VASWSQSLGDAKTHPVTFAAFQEIPLKRFGVLAAGMSQLGFRTPYLDNELVRLAYQSPERLRTSAMPVRFIQENNKVLSAIPTDMGHLGKARTWAAARWFCRATFKLDYIYNEGLPHWLSFADPLFRDLASTLGILGLHKHLHYRSWFRRELASYTNSILRDSQMMQSPFWNRDFLGRLADRHTRGRANYVLEINAVFTLEAVERLLFRELPRDSELVNKANAVAMPTLSK